LPVKAKDLPVKAKDLTVKAKDLPIKAKDLTVKAKYVKPVLSSDEVKANYIVKPKRLCRRSAKLRKAYRRIWTIDS